MADHNERCGMCKHFSKGVNDLPCKNCVEICLQGFDYTKFVLDETRKRNELD
jgi:hypothetical protein